MKAAKRENPSAEGHDDRPLPEILALAFKAPTSGGSTGRPKIILSGDPAVVPITDGRPTTPIGLPAESVVMFPSPLYHNLGIAGTAYFREVGEVLAASAGGPPDVAALAEVMRRHGLTPAQPATT